MPALRGRILDAKGRVLAETRAVTALVVDRQKLTVGERARLVPSLAHALGIDTEEVNRRLDSVSNLAFEAVDVAEPLTDDQAQYVLEHREDFPDTRITSSFIREYEGGTLAAHVLGYTGQINAEEYEARKADGYQMDDIIGKSGIEQTFESDLRGKPELKKVSVDNRGVKIGESVTRKAEPGHDVQLNIDIDAQRIAEDSLAAGMEGARRLIDPDSGSYYQATGGAVAVLDAAHRRGRRAVFRAHVRPERDRHRRASPRISRSQRTAPAHRPRAQPRTRPAPRSSSSRRWPR